MTTARTTENLIAEAEATEAALVALLDALKSTLTTSETMTQTLAGGGDAFARNAQSAAAMATNTARTHPIATAVLAAGAAWLLFGSRRGTAKPSTEEVTGQAAEAWKDRTIAVALGLAAGVGVAWMLPRSCVAIQSAVPGAIGAVVTPAAALFVQNLMTGAAKLMDPFVRGDAPQPNAPASGPEPERADEANGKAGAERAAQAAPKHRHGQPEDAEKQASPAPAARA